MRESLVVQPVLAAPVDPAGRLDPAALEDLHHPFRLGHSQEGIWTIPPCSRTSECAYAQSSDLTTSTVTPGQSPLGTTSTRPGGHVVHARSSPTVSSLTPVSGSALT